MHSKYLNYFLAFSLCVFCSCEDQEIRENKVLKSKVVGEWYSVSLKLTMHTFNNSQETKVFEVTEQNWREKMNIHPIKTIYFGDGSYMSTHFNLNDSVIYSPGGRWVIMGDTIIMRDTFPMKGAEYKYKISIDKDIAHLYGKEDLDGDGKVDDDYAGAIRKQNRY